MKNGGTLLMGIICGLLIAIGYTSGMNKGLDIGKKQATDEANAAAEAKINETVNSVQLSDAAECDERITRQQDYAKQSCDKDTADQLHIQKSMDDEDAKKLALLAFKKGIKQGKKDAAKEQQLPEKTIPFVITVPAGEGK